MQNPFRNWSDVRVFLAVLRQGSTLAASGQLGMAQPTVARRIDALEHELRVTLFLRDTRGFKPTDDAQRLLPLAEAMEAAAENLSTEAAALSAPRPIRVTAYSGNFSPKIMALFMQFSKRHPRVDFDFLPGQRVLDLMAGEADIALRILSTPPDPALICRHISDAQYTLCGARSYQARHGLPKSPQDLAGHQFVSYLPVSGPARMHEWLQAHVSPDQIVKHYREVDLMIAAIRSGLGLGLSNLKLAEGEDDLIPCFAPIASLARPHVLLVAPLAYRRPEVKAFVRFFAPRYAKLFR